ncbi:MAG: aminotransferase class V-fold PLP-dependent enzyme [Gemmatimonadales bacterium]|nr:aminotransferase class V-fold PLP-dependent enzyme [Gemmatimonadales bacterium]
MAILPSQRALFELPSDIAYLNAAYMGPLSRDVAAAGRAGVDAKLRPWLLKPADFFVATDGARAAFARLLGSPATGEDIAIVPAASYGMAVAAANLPLRAGQRVLTLEAEFPSTILTWRDRARAVGAEFVQLPRPEDHDWTRVVLEAIDERTAVAALPQCHWIDGARLDLARIGARLREVGGALALDLTQSLGALPIDLAAVDPDFLVVACYKWMLGPYSTGFLYVAPRRQEGRPLEQHWFGRIGSQNFSALGYPEGFQPGARRFDVGEPSNFALLPAAVAAIEQLITWGVANVADTAAALADRIVAEAAGRGLVAVPSPLRARHYVGLKASRPLPTDLPDRLARERVFVSVRGGSALRITPHVYNEPWEVDRLFAVLDAALGG